MAGHLGCFINLKDGVNAIAFVALGTSVPGTVVKLWDYFAFGLLCSIQYSQYYLYKKIKKKYILFILMLCFWKDVPVSSVQVISQLRSHKYSLLGKV